MQHDFTASPRKMAGGTSRPASVALSSRTAHRFGYGALLVLACTLLLVNLTTYPLPWFDEGYFLAVAKTLVNTGLYAVPNSNGPWVMDASITTGPTAIIPLALVFKLFGVGMLQARLLAVTFAAGALVAYALLARRLAGPTAAIVAVLLLLAGNPEPYTSFVFLSRQLVGEVLALGLWMYGVWLWLHTLDAPRPRWWQWVCVGLAFGAAIVTKPQMIVGVVPALGITCLLDRFYYRQADWRAFIIPGVALLGCFGAWYVAPFIIVGAESFQRSNAVLQSGVRSNIIGFDLVHIEHALGTLWRSGFFLWGLPGVAYGFVQARKRDRQGLAQAWVLSLVVLWLVWYVTFSIGWSRYGFVPLALTTIWTGALFVAAWRRWATPARRAVVVALLLVLLVGNSYTIVTTIFGPQNTSAAEFSAYLAANLPADTIVESWEWDLDSTAPQRFHHPPPLVMYTVIDLMQREQPVPKNLYDPAAAGAPYIIDGPFSSWTGVYHDYVTARGEKIKQIGGYALYKVVR